MPKVLRVAEWPKFDNRAVTSIECLDNRRYLLFGQSIADPSAQVVLSSQLRSTRIGYQIFEGKAVLQGILVSQGQQGRGSGERMIEYFLDNVGELEGEFAGTGRIHKPVVGLQLARVGLKAQQTDFSATILPQSKYDKTPHVPKILVTRDEVVDRQRVIDRVDTNSFYEVIGPEEAIRTYPIGGHDVHLHTTFE